jgi:hypothetical protein
VNSIQPIQYAMGLESWSASKERTSGSVRPCKSKLEPNHIKSSLKLAVSFLTLKAAPDGLGSLLDPEGST